MRHGTKPPQPPGKSSRLRARTLEKFVVEEIELGGGPELDQAGPRRRLIPRFRLPFGTALGWLALWLALVLATLAGREAWPFDETRELAIAWEMWSSGHWRVPTLNGEAIGRAPLFSWLILAGWKFAGVDELLYARALAPLFSLGSLGLLVLIARKLWPGSPMVASYVPYFALGSVFLTLISPALRPETVGLFFTLLAVWGLLIMWRSRDARAWLLFGPAFGMAMLAQGGVALLSVLPVAMLAPLWARGPVQPVWRHWYFDVIKGLLLAVALVSAWLVPAVREVGPLYLVRVVTDSFALQTLEFFPARWPWWGYLLQLPVALLPWSVLPLLWLRLLHAGRAEFNAGVAFCLVWAVSTALALSPVAVKQPSFLLAPLTALILLAAWLAFEPRLEGRGDHHPLAGMTLPMMLVGGAIIVIPKLPRTDYLPAVLWDVSPLAGVAVMIIGIALAWMPAHEVRQRVLNSAVLVVMAVTIAILVAGSQLAPFQRLEPVAQAIAEHQAAGRPVAHAGPYRGEYHHAGRLRHPLVVLDVRDADQWYTQHPNGVVVASSETWQPTDARARRLLLDHRFRDYSIRLWGHAP